ncbi:hypothetical protein TH66_20390 [Carbonactinospora thermoautotrophica]|uniref:DUF1273 domain-containing protein n=1 Tax=Carbonactinospora thermoautotrophica TaxID=1469144 RepID=A0A132MIZ2_9ACTN|nr:hypothetical protein [Carbonactinospora thermoautotrophica]KWW97804.1 hypothetical protein TH66_20390 [Carbonactinospora thermoautotrophica]KWX09382.1 hypothetical protein TR74_09915 [Carbonactinospora thermoautotrophica]
MTRIGITGHSGLPEDTAVLVYRALREGLEPYTGDELRGITCLAHGADQIFARAVLDAGGEYEVILPAPDYREAKVKPHNLAEFDELLAKAVQVTYMPFEKSGREAYMAASKELIRRSERLFAVWDGQPSGGYGGTADVVEAARKAGLPVDVFWPAGARRR